jgi:hypothetical protein
MFGSWNLLSREIAVLIPRSNIWRWKNESADKYETFDLNLRACQDYDLIRSFARDKKAKRIFSAYVRISKFFVSLVQNIPKFHKHIHQNRVEVVKVIERVKVSLSEAHNKVIKYNYLYKMAMPMNEN